MPGRRLQEIPGGCFSAAFLFSIVYREVDSGIVIFAVAHQSRRPEYWAIRVQDR
jgi:hypothetical protein